MTGFNIRKETHIHETILFRFPGGSDDAIIVKYYMLYAKHYIYLEKLKVKIKKWIKHRLFWAAVPPLIHTQDRKKYLYH